MFIGITKKTVSSVMAIKKSRKSGTLYMDGLVSTRNFFIPIAILKQFVLLQKNSMNFLYTLKNKM